MSVKSLNIVGKLHESEVPVESRFCKLVDSCSIIHSLCYTIVAPSGGWNYSKVSVAAS